MALDNIQIKDEYEKIKQNESLSANSIHFKKNSLNNAEKRIKELKEARDAALKGLETTINTIADNISEDQIENTIIMDYAMVIANLEKEINILEAVQGPVELVKSRAIRLVKKMITAAKENSKGIYNELEKNKKIEKTPINVEKISEKYEEPIKNNIDTAIKDESLNIDDIREVVDDSLVINREDIQRKINEKMTEYLIDEEIAKIEAKIAETEKEQEKEDEDYEYTPMTDEEIAKVRKDNKFDEYEKQYAAEATMANGLSKFRSNMDKLFDDNGFIREPIQVVPERVESKELVETKDENKEVSPVVIEKEETVAPKQAIASADFIKKLQNLSQEELDAELSAMASRMEQLEAEANNVKEDKEKGLRINSEIVAEEEAIEKKDAEFAEEEAGIEKEQAELKAEDAKVAQEVREKSIKKLLAMREGITALTNTIQSDREELANVNKDTENRRENITIKNKSIENRRENITNITRANEELKESINKRREVSMMLSEEEKSEDPIQKIM